MRPSDPDVLIIGGGPCGMMAGLLFAKAGCSVRVVEKHADFLHDFRGDTVHPATMDVLAQLGLRDAFLRRPHQRLTRAELRIGGRSMIVGDLSRVRSATPFVAMMPQWEFLDFLRGAAAEHPGFRLDLDCPVDTLFEEDGRVAGARLASGEVVRPRLVLAADGRRSIVRRDGWLPVRELGSPIDVFWFELPKTDAEAGILRIAVEGGRILVRVDRGDYWQCAFVFRKGEAERLRAGGVGAFNAAVRATDKRLGPNTALSSTAQLHLLEVTLDHLTRWHRPGLLAIGDAAHAMSPMGGIGINLAIQDAVAAANLLVPALLRGAVVDPLLGKVQRRRAGSTRLIQWVQRVAQDRVLAPMLGAPAKVPATPPWPLLLLDRLPALRCLPGRAIALGVRNETVSGALAA